VFGRAIASWIVAGVEKADPMIHFVADSDREAHIIMARIFAVKLGEEDDSLYRKVQIELGGHIFLDRRRLLRRSPWPARLFGILAAPYNLADKGLVGGDEEQELQTGLLPQDGAKSIISSDEIAFPHASPKMLRRSTTVSFS
jgi:hypothetical protein